MKTKPKVKPIHRIIAFPFQVIGFAFLMVFVVSALITAPWRARKLWKILKDGWNEKH